MQVVSRRGEMVFLEHERPMAAILPLSSHNGQGICMVVEIQHSLNYTTLLLTIKMEPYVHCTAWL